jgi:hypothetical protein
MSSFDGPLVLFHNCDLHSMERQIGNAGKIAKPNHNLFICKVKTRLGFAREKAAWSVDDRLCSSRQSPSELVVLQIG